MAKKHRKQSGGGLRALFPRYENTSVDLTFMVLVLLLLVFGLVMMFSASYAQGYYREGNSFHYITRQLVWAVAGLCAMFIFSRMDYHFWRKLAWPLFPVVTALLVLCYFMPAVNDAHRWIFIGNFQFQPSELAKFSLVLLFSHLLVSNEKKLGQFRYGIFPFAVILGVYAGLIVKEPHLSATILLVVMGGIMLVVGGLPAKWIAAAGGLVAAGVAAIMLIPSLHERAMGRITIWQDPSSDPLGTGYQTLQSLYAIGSGGLMGAGIGNSRQKYLFLPEPQNDFVFSVVCEELGFIGALLVILAAHLAGLYHRHQGPRPLRRHAGHRLYRTGGGAGHSQYGGRHQYHSGHRHQSAVLFLRRYRTGHPAGRNGHHSVGLPPNDSGKGVA